MRVTSWRKVVMGFGGMGFLFGGLLASLRWSDAGKVVYTAFASSVVAIVTAVVIGNVGEHFANKGQPK